MQNWPNWDGWFETTMVDKGSTVTVVGSNKMHRTIAARKKDQKAIGNARQESGACSCTKGPAGI